MYYIVTRRITRESLKREFSVIYITDRVQLRSTKQRAVFGKIYALRKEL